MQFVKVRQDNAITIPFELRQKHAIVPGAWFEVSGDDSGHIILSSQKRKCSLCGNEATMLDLITGACDDCTDAASAMVRKGVKLTTALRYIRKRQQLKVANTYTPGGEKSG